MIFRTVRGWQTTTADLALILFFVVTAAGTGAKADRAIPALQTYAANSTPPAGVYRPNGSATLTAWLAGQALDDRQVATVLVRHIGTPSPGAMRRGLDYLADIAAAGRQGRLIVEQGTSEEVLVILAYDGGSTPGMAFADR